MATRGSDVPALARGGRRVTVLGLAKSGVAAARLLRAVERGRRGGGREAARRRSGAEAAALAELGVRLVTGRGRPDGGLRRRRAGGGEPRRAARRARRSPPRGARQVPIIGELELGWRASEADTIAITGTNGKTTTTALTGALLARSRGRCWSPGNIGTPLAAHALTFPADGPGRLRGVELPARDHRALPAARRGGAQLTPDHLDRHRTFEAYRGREGSDLREPDLRRLRRAERRRRGDARAWRRRSRAPIVWFSRPARARPRVFVRDGSDRRASSTATSRRSARCRRSSCVASTTWRTSSPRPRAPSGPASRPRSIRRAIGAFPGRGAPDRVGARLWTASSTTTTRRARTSTRPSGRSRASRSRSC